MLLRMSKLMEHDLTEPRKPLTHYRILKEMNLRQKKPFVYSLEDDSDLHDFEEAEANYMDLIPTTELIKSIDVDC